jgi:hypothetical protein
VEVGYGMFYFRWPFTLRKLAIPWVHLKNVLRLCYLANSFCTCDV